MLAIAFILVLDVAVDEREQSIDAALSDVCAWMELGPALTNENVAGENELTVRALYAQSLCVRVSAVLSRAAALFMCE